MGISSSLLARQPTELIIVKTYKECTSQDAWSGTGRDKNTKPCQRAGRPPFRVKIPAIYRLFG